MSGLYVVEYAADSDSIDRELRRYDGRLFLTYEIDPRFDAKVYVVLCEVEGDRPPLAVCEWRDELGRPLPLSSGILDRVKSLAPRGGVSVQEAIDANEAMVATIKREADEAMDEIAEDVGARMAGKRSAALPRGQHIRRGRDKRRARGENV